MAPTYNTGRRGPNVSHFLRDLNTLPTDKSLEAEFTFEDDLAMFTNTQFFDFDSGQNTDYQAHPIKSEVETAPSSAVSPTDDLETPATLNDMTNLDFLAGESTTISSSDTRRLACLVVPLLAPQSMHLCFLPSYPGTYPTAHSWISLHCHSFLSYCSSPSRNPSRNGFETHTPIISEFCALRCFRRYNTLIRGVGAHSHLISVIEWWLTGGGTSQAALR